MIGERSWKRGRAGDGQSPPVRLSSVRTAPVPSDAASPRDAGAAPVVGATVERFTIPQGGSVVLPPLETAPP